MDERSILIAAFVGGALLQAIILIRADWNWMKIGVSIFISLGVVAIGSDKASYNQDQHIYLGLFAFAGLIAFLFKEDILPAVSEKLLLSYTLTFWFAFFVYYFKGTPFQIGILCICLLPTAATIVLALKRAVLTTFWKIGFYTWFLCIIVALGLLRYSFAQLSMFYDNRELPWLSPFESLVGGMAFLYLVVNAAYLYYLIPIPGKGQSWDSRMKDWHQFTDLMVQRFDGSPPTHARTLLILILQSGVLLLDYFFHLLPAGFLISGFILLPAVILSLRSSQQAGPEEGANTPAAARVPHSRHLKKLLKKSRPGSSSE